ncbi:hypothetical protein [Niabella ginsengisoli]|uniref:Uncharacterized protein n=1 Tax=Niabella ginsengisoli TaxID=522298 RepID=A0ABS9SQG8_9BACT|nr:hypothetical protein [Niabella ginsengisoli]MCH5600612.1 hypothetical protein [Niabella ginsengisoli]
MFFISKAPFLLATAPLAVPFNVIETDSAGCPSDVVTLPFMLPVFWANIAKLVNRKKNDKKST